MSGSLWATFRPHPCLRLGVGHREEGTWQLRTYKYQGQDTAKVTGLSLHPGPWEPRAGREMPTSSMPGLVCFLLCPQDAGVKQVLKKISVERLHCRDEVEASLFQKLVPESSRILPSVCVALSKPLALSKLGWLL